ncbi:MAG: hypothetical protein AAF383_25730, partial [Cyanobacteria bacterium P01_A01_bin.83]
MPKSKSQLTRKSTPSNSAKNRTRIAQNSWRSPLHRRVRHKRLGKPQATRTCKTTVPAVTSSKRAKSKPNHQSSQSILRLFLVWGVLVVSALGLGCRLYYLQIVDPVITYQQAPQGKKLTQIAIDQQTATLNFYIPRRQIVDRQQNVLATDRITYTLYVHPHLFVRNSQPVPAAEIAEQLASIIGNKTKEELLTIFAKQDWGIRLAGDLPESAKAKIAKMQIDGLDLKKNYTRFYPHREMAAEVTGYVNRDTTRTPQAGVEFTQEQLLQRSPISWKMKRSFNNQKSVFHPGDLDRSQQLFNFDDLRLQLTIDLRLQQIARNALKKQMDYYKAKRGAVIVMDVRDGAIA